MGGIHVMIIDFVIFIVCSWYRWKESNLHPHVRSMVSCSLNDSDMIGAPTMIRTRHLLITNQLLYLMSYRGKIVGGATETRTQNPDYAERQISNLL